MLHSSVAVPSQKVILYMKHRETQDLTPKAETVGNCAETLKPWKILWLGELMSRVSIGPRTFQDFTEFCKNSVGLYPNIALSLN